MLDEESMIVINSGHAPNLDENNYIYKSQKFLYDIFRDLTLEIDAIIPYDEPLAQPFNSAFYVLFDSIEDSYYNFFRQTSNLFDIDTIQKIFPSNEIPYARPMVFYDGPTHKRYQKPTRAWED